MMKSKCSNEALLVSPLENNVASKWRTKNNNGKVCKIFSWREATVTKEKICKTELRLWLRWCRLK